MDNSSRSVFQVILPDVVGVIVVLLVQLYYSQFRDPFKSGFFCDDESLRYPLLPQTVPSQVLNVIGISSCVIIIFVVEVIRRNDNTTPYSIGSYKILQWQFYIYQMLMGYGFGALTNHLLTTVGKKTIGRLRPHFWYTCRPNISDSCDGFAQYAYITDYACRNEHKEAVNDIRVSFPSGHSSFSFYCAVFIVMYLEARWKANNLIYIKSTIQFIALLGAWFTALSRVTDNKHHWSDVLAGMILGIVVALLTTIYVMGLFRQSKISRKSIADGVNGEPTLNTHSESHIQL